MKNSHIPELITAFYAPFEQLLDAHPSMLFSGKFGSGKTYFLNHYFKQPENQAKYCMVYTQPSAYYHAADGDVLGYLKYDILMELLRQTNLEELEGFHGTELTYFEMLMAMIAPEGIKQAGGEQVVMGAAAALLLLAGQGAELGAEKLAALAKSTWASSKSLNKGLEWLKEKRKEANEDDATRLEDYLEALSQRSNSLFETSAINELIHALIAKQRKPSKGGDDSDVPGKEVVLVVDDLDRMLPDDCLGFLNLLSTHVRPGNDEGVARRANLYGFDKIVLVADDANVQAFIRKKFGEAFDRTGYMVKLFGQQIIRYDPASELTSLVQKKFEWPLITRLREEDEEREPMRFSNTFEERIHNVFTPLVECMVAIGVLTIRDVEKLAAANYNWMWERQQNSLYTSGGASEELYYAGAILLQFIVFAFNDDVKHAQSKFEHTASYADLRGKLSPFTVATLLHSGLSRDDYTTDLDNVKLNVKEPEVELRPLIRESPTHRRRELVAQMSREDADKVLVTMGFRKLVLKALGNLNAIQK